MAAAVALLASEQDGNMDVTRFHESVGRLLRLLDDNKQPADTVYLALALLHARYAPPEAFPASEDERPATLDDGNLREPVERAVAFLEKSVEANGGNLASRRLLAFLMENLDDERAVQGWQRLVELQPDHLEGLNRLGEGLLLLKQYDEAERIGSQALAVATTQANEEAAGQARNVLGRAYLQTGRYDLAEQMFKDAAVRTDGSHWGCAYQSLGQLYATLGQLDVNPSTEEPSRQAYLRSLELYQAGAFQDALSSIQEALLAHKRTEYRTLRGLSLLQLERIEEAATSLKDTAASAPEAAGPLIGLAELALRASRHSEAEQYVHQALSAWKQRDISQSGLPRYHRLLHSLACDLHGRLRINRQDAGRPDPDGDTAALAQAVCGMELGEP